jgi:hypothetical protein
MPPQPHNQLQQQQLCRDHHHTLQQQCNLKPLLRPKENPQDVADQEDEADQRGEGTEVAGRLDLPVLRDVADDRADNQDNWDDYSVEPIRHDEVPSAAGTPTFA